MEDKGFLSSLFDTSFSEFVTPRIIKALFVLAIIGSGIGALFLLIKGIDGGVIQAFISIVLAPVAFLLYVLLARIWLEVVIVLFRIAENTDKLAGRDEGKDESADE